MNEIETLSVELSMAMYYVVALKPGTTKGTSADDVVQPCNYYQCVINSAGKSLLAQLNPVPPTAPGVPVTIPTDPARSNYICLQQLSELPEQTFPPLQEGVVIDLNAKLFSATLKTVNTPDGPGPFQNNYLASSAGPGNNQTLILDASSGSLRGAILTFVLDKVHTTATGLVIGLRATFDPEIKGTT